jgi:hypothetical protein
MKTSHNTSLSLAALAAILVGAFALCAQRSEAAAPAPGGPAYKVLSAQTASKRVDTVLKIKPKSEFFETRPTCPQGQPKRAF